MFALYLSKGRVDSGQLDVDELTETCFHGKYEARSLVLFFYFYDETTFLVLLYFNWINFIFHYLTELRYYSLVFHYLTKFVTWKLAYQLLENSFMYTQKTETSMYTQISPGIRNIFKNRFRHRTCTSLSLIHI